MYLASVVNLGMIWCFGFIFLELLDDFDEKSNNDDALASLDDADRNWAAIPTDVTPRKAQSLSPYVGMLPSF